MADARTNESMGASDGRGGGGAGDGAIGGAAAEEELDAFGNPIAEDTRDEAEGAERARARQSERRQLGFYDKAQAQRKRCCNPDERGNLFGCYQHHGRDFAMCIVAPA